MYRAIAFSGIAVGAVLIFWMFSLSFCVLQNVKEENSNGSTYSVVEKCDTGPYSNVKDYVRHKCNENS